MEIRPILSTLGRHKTAALLIVLQIALTSAIVCNALFLIGNRLERMQRPSGVVENELVRIQIAGIGTSDNPQSRTRTDLAALRAVPGVKAASVTNEIVFDNSSWNSGVKLDPKQTHTNLNATDYMADDGFFDTLGLHLVEGRAFHADEFMSFESLDSASATKVPVAVVTRAMADKLFPDGHALGRDFYSWGDTSPTRIIGIVDNLARPNDNPAGYQYSMIFPIRVPYTKGGRYILRTDPARRAEVMQAAVAALQAGDPNRIVLNQDNLSDMRIKFYKQDRTMAWMLVLVIALLLLVTALGIVGLASFWVQQRTRQIGVRRALGATRMQILRYFQTENFLLVTVGIVVGMLLAYALNQLLMAKAELPRLPYYYLPFGAVALWLLGQLAVFWPARRAAAVPPAIATRSA
ncbi:MAG: FtsX-like permease family protein [Pseudomonadota bacterium]